jgi:phosphorylase/glycogen(starch) synthase
MLGRTLAGTGKDAAGARAPTDLAEALGVRGKHSLEGACCREADVLTTVGATTSEEIERYHGRKADVLLPNGIDVETIAAVAPQATPASTYAKLVRVASRFTGQDLTGARVVCVTGRNEFRNKGFDLALAAAAELGKRPGAPVVFFLFVPSGNSGVRREVAERLRSDAPASGPLGVCTHQLHAPDSNEVVKACAELGLANARGARVKVVYVPEYLQGTDGVIDLPYEAVVRAADVTACPSLYDAWGCTPQESLALGVPTVTSDCAGFGRWAASAELGPADGVHVLARAGRTFEACRDDLASVLDAALSAGKSPELAERCRAAARRTSWSEFVANYDDAFARAVGVAAARPATARVAPRVDGPRPPVAAKPRVFPLEVESALPPELSGLARLASNWRFTWDPEVSALFEEISPAAWEEFRGNPVRVLREAKPEALAARARDSEYVARVGRALARTDAYLAAPPREAGGLTAKRPVAYVCAEFGLHECLPIYSGGLGILAGDHLRAASDVGVPLVALGLLYRKGYMRQRLRGGVEQTELPDEFDPRLVPLTLVVDADGHPVEAAVTMPATTLRLRAWRADVGRVSLYLLDTDFDGNRPEDRVVTHELYGGGAEYRVRQEIALGRGGVRLLAKLGIEPSAWHVNEGHGAFVAVERAERFVREAGLTFEEAREAVRATTAFTTHTPVPAGHDVFDEDLMRRHFSHVPERLGLSWEAFFALGASPDGPGFNMTNLALGFASFVNGVSRRHGEVSRELLRATCPHLAVEEMPITSVTNGVHVAAWTSAEIARLLPTDGSPVTGADFSRAATLDDDALWSARRRLRARLLARVADHVRRSFEERNDSPALLERVLASLEEEALLVGFARRFATYKRADLALSVPDRLRAILGAKDRPVRLFVAGKAHPRDGAAKELVGKLARLARTDEFVGRLVVLENYDMGLARTLVQGVDVWLNTPRPPLEASGTSGMKAAANGALNLSVGDGWWLEAFDGSNGWQIGGGRPAADDAVRDELDAASLYRLLEEEVVPLFFRRDAHGVPREWIGRVRRSLATIPPVFDTARMVAEYRARAYEPLASRFDEIRADGHVLLRADAARRARLVAGFASARIAECSVAASATAGRPTTFRVDVDLGALSVDEIAVEVVVGRRGGGELRDVVVVPLEAAPPTDGAPRRFVGSFTPAAPGSFGWFARVRPRGPATLHDPAVWA